MLMYLLFALVGLAQLNGVRGLFWRRQKPFNKSPVGVELFSQSVPTEEQAPTDLPSGAPVYYVRLKLKGKSATYLRVEENAIVKPMCEAPPAKAAEAAEAAEAAADHSSHDPSTVRAMVSSSDTFDFPQELAGFSQTWVKITDVKWFKLPEPERLSSDYVRANCVQDWHCVAVVKQNDRIGLRLIKGNTNIDAKALIDFGNFWTEVVFGRKLKKYVCKRIDSTRISFTLDMKQTVLNAFPYHKPFGGSTCTAFIFPETDGTVSALDDAFWSDDSRSTRGVKTGIELRGRKLDDEDDDFPCKVKLSKKNGELTTKLAVVKKRRWWGSGERCTATFDGPLATPAIVSENYVLKAGAGRSIVKAQDRIFSTREVGGTSYTIWPTKGAGTNSEQRPFTCFDKIEWEQTTQAIPALKEERAT